KDLNDQARAILRANDRGGYTIPTAGLYPYQWNWDSAFTAWGIADYDTARAWEEFDWLMRGQWKDGMVPHILFHKDDPGYFPGPDVWSGVGPIKSSGISQPPVAATFARMIWEQDPETGNAQIRTLVPKLMDWHRWYMMYRTKDGAVFTTHPWESGRDNAADWDEAMSAIDPKGVGEYTRRDTGHVDPSMRPTKADYDRFIWLVQRGREVGWDAETLAGKHAFCVFDPTLHFTLLRGCRDLVVMAKATGNQTKEIEGWIETLEAGSEMLWNPDLKAYDARNVATGNFAGCLTNASYLSFFAGIDNPDMLAHLERAFENSKYPIASLDASSTKFEARRYWRGPSWGMMNTLAGLGLAECGHTALAERLRQGTRDLLARHGFAEYYDPMDGSPAGGGAFSWTAAIWLRWASDEKTGPLTNEGSQ
ncbi:MAG: hypothetical protein AAFN59_05985, partial [Pseudomonadota bacterium]